ncbi:hypothetical protein REC12_04765 [Desulfosporosinus sp. PR]|uniref:hypothetical protein n=1 Tax=Candidatus Desulfosporosinus nitrosoreducens TaxID=3401928 RepID=UPI0027EE8BDD|nr:hypothetical protein [Desulfosporosinus sp. PR]MDQ7092894.1 hypothetical protein [Desulfosporosinus sp. PR]
MWVWRGDHGILPRRVSDILMYNGLFGSAFSKVSVSETAMLVFVLTQTVSLFLTNNRLFTEVKESEHKLANEKEILEKPNRLKT